MGTTFNSINKPGTYRFDSSGALALGYLPCDGSIVSRNVYAALFSEIGETYGAGNGTTTFQLPDWRGRSPIGSGTGPGLTARSIGDYIGEETHALIEDELPSHIHGPGTLAANLSSPTHQHNTIVAADPSRNVFGFGSGGLSSFGSSYANSSLRHLTDAQNITHGHAVSGSTASVGIGTAHNNMQPSLVCTIGVKY